MESKTEIRKKNLQKRKNLTSEQNKLLSKKIVDNFLATLTYQKSDQILSYISFNNEVQTELIIKESLKKMKKVGAPKIVGNEILAFEINHLGDLNIGKYSILEPTTTKPFYVTENTIIIIPGVAFDKNGTRLGFGKGFYDRFLSDQPGIKIALAYDFQIVKKIPKDKHDIPMDMIITEHGTINCNNKE